MSEDQVTLVAVDTFPPYRKGEVFTVDKKVAEVLLSGSTRQNDFGPVYPQVKVREYDPETDEHLLLQNGTLNQKDAARLREKLSRPLSERRASAKADDDAKVEDKKK